ncbi:hypothetical protein [Croceimicrobium hydrocarbonivorans]|uniref:Outer membrane protein beta-barrel domain-containing protein n=1 Tax=Croceimicrobium hydrocarbonivorans TaxID=2761580 RepID=A0A7H0VB14_9FLAO|nr:hypothetical protein [Croceimicrobium hydrocarbonivorans]QNR22912.1 hypothetical protein H4K34_11035 [Croceimicrobium hydrocarbonivorans]
MRKLFTLGFVFIGLSLMGQVDDDIHYYTDSDVNKSRFNLALNLNPYYTDMRLINSDASNSLFNTYSEEFKATGSFKLDYGLDLFYEIGPSFHLGIGIVRAHGGYTWQDVVLDTLNPSFLADNEVDITMFSIPIKVNFTTRISDVFSLEVVPMVEMNFLDQYNGKISYNGNPNAPADSTFNLNKDLTKLNWSVGIALGGTYWVSSEFGIFARGSVRYLLNDIVDPDGYSWPRETLLNFGLNTGVRIRF